MTVLDPEFHGKVHFPFGLILAAAVIAAVFLLWAASTVERAKPEPVPANDYFGCAADAVGCEMQWMQENLTNIEHPVLILVPDSP
ncbi:MAG: hypothetical protein QNJ16_00415 [Rhodobacter sp.]|nr:hypothetical protein [Rhodobacter sp.]